MYRIEVASGEETVFRTIEELAVGIRNGVVTPRARIYHHASQKWLPISLHPHYKKALEMPAASASHAPVTSTTPIPTPSRPKGHSLSQPRPLSGVHFPEPKRAPEPKPTPEPESTPSATPKVPPPVQSPVIAMQNEVLRDLPVISIPEPLPWTVKPRPPVAPTAQAHAPAVDAPAANEPAVQAPMVHAPVTHAPVTHAPVTHAPVTHAPVTHAPVTHALVTHAQVRHTPAAHTPVAQRTITRAPASHAAVEPARPAEKPRDAEADELPPPRPTVRRSRRIGGRPLLLLGAAAALVLGGHLALPATPSASADPSDAPLPTAGSEQADPGGTGSAGTDSAGTGSAGSRASESPRVTIEPARAPMTPGPAFAGSVPARPGADSAGRPKAAIERPAPEPAPDAVSIAPAPAAIELALPGLPPDSIAPAARPGDTVGMKKILRALNGAKPGEASAAP